MAILLLGSSLSSALNVSNILLPQDVKQFKDHMFNAFNSAVTCKPMVDIVYAISMDTRPFLPAGAMRLKKRKCLDSDNLEEDEDFIPSGGDELLEDMEEDEEDLESELAPANQCFNKSNASTFSYFGGQIFLSCRRTTAY